VTTTYLGASERHLLAGAVVPLVRNLHYGCDYTCLKRYAALWSRCPPRPTVRWTRLPFRGFILNTNHAGHAPDWGEHVPEDFLLGLAAELRASQATRDLAESPTQIWTALNKHWAQTHLTWFTDHGVDHALQVARRAQELSTIPELSANQQLSSLERYILCAASLLHDIGMNDLTLSENPLGAMRHEDYQRIRHEHSARSGAMIIRDPVAWGLPSDRILAELVGLVAKAHGTKYYRKTIPELQERGAVRNLPVRGPLLAALLLMADELDLSYTRVVELPGNVPLNAVSEAHAFKHRCISSAWTKTAVDGTISVSLQLRMPDELADQAKVNVERWVVGKLRRQMALVDPEITGAFGKRLSFSRAIGVSYVRPLDPESEPLPSADALAVINADVALDDLIDHREKFHRAVTALVDGHVVITGPWDAAGRKDSYGREDLYQAMIDRLRADPDAVVACSTRLHVIGAGEVSDVLEEWVRDLNGDDEFTATEPTDEQSARAKLMAACVAAARALNSDKTLVLGVSCIDRLIAEADMRWLASTAVSQISRASSARLRLIMTAENPVPALEPQVSVIPTEDIDRGEVEDFLRGIGVADATAIPGPESEYFTLKQICNRKLMELQSDGQKLVRQAEGSP
jgi:hypothetical protein